MKCEENKQVFEKLMILIFQYIKEKTVIQKDDSQIIKQLDAANTSSSMPLQDQKLVLNSGQNSNLIMTDNKMNEQIQSMNLQSQTNASLLQNAQTNSDRLITSQLK